MSKSEHDRSITGRGNGSQALPEGGATPDAAQSPEETGNRAEPPPEKRNWRASLVTRLVHTWFAFTRGMTLGVRAAAFDEAGRVFLVRHSYVPGWHMPGGGVERGETLLEALAKELSEEGNLEIIGAPDLVTIYFNSATSRRDHVALYRCTVTQSAPKQADREILEAGFFAPDQLPEGVTRATRRRLAELAGDTPFSEIW